MRILALCLLLVGCAPDHRTRIAAKNGQDCALVRYGGHGWQVEGADGPANFAALNEAVDFAKQVCGGGSVQTRIGE